MTSTHLALLLVAVFLATVCAFQSTSRNVGVRSYCTVSSSKTIVGSTAMRSGSVIDVNPATAVRDIATMDQWASACGVQRAEGFQLTSDDGGRDMSVMTNQNIPANSPVLLVPNAMILSAVRARQEIGSVETAEKRLILTKTARENLPQFYLFLKVLIEYEKGSDSPWCPWMNGLPRAFYNGASMTTFCFDCLPPFAGWLARKERVRFIQFFQALKSIDFLSYETTRNKQLAQWAYSVVFTRGMATPDGDFRIAPFADMFNHGTETEVQYQYDEEGNCYALTTRDVPAGSPLRMSYGDPTNPSYLLARYGFLDETSPASFCKIMIKNPSKELQDMGYDQSRMLFYKDTGAVSEEVWDVLLYQILGQADQRTQQAFYQAHVSGNTSQKQAIHQQWYPQTLQALQNHVDTFLQDLDRLSGQADGRDWNKHPRLPLIMSHNAFVRETFLKVRANLQR